MSKTPIKDREPTDAHVDLAAYINDVHGVLLAPDTVALVLRAYPLFRATEEAQAARLAAKVTRAQEEDERRARRIERDRVRLAALEEKRAKLLANLPPVTEADVPSDPDNNSQEDAAAFEGRFTTSDDDEFEADSVDLTSLIDEVEDF